MRCPACSSENRAGARFCGECAQPLGETLSCRKCGGKNGADRKFCDACGEPIPARGARARDPRAYTPSHLVEKILTSRSALEGERKHVTVLFADVRGSMDLAETVDAEEWHRILDRFFAILSEGIHRFEGTINQFTGDGVMALFGAPIAHEDHAHRACFAALALREDLADYSGELRRTRGLNFSVRMGINSGEVIVGKIGDDLRMDYTAQGRTVGLAARVEQLAAPDRAYLTDATAELVAGYFHLKELGEFAIKGVRDAVRLFDLESVGPMRTRLDVSRARGFSRFVGRERESRVLDDALESALAGQGNLVAIVADAGVGKSRLTHEFATRARGRGVSVFEAHGVAHGKTVPLLPVLELLRSYFGIGERDDDAEARRKIAGTLVLLDEAFQTELPMIFDFLGVGDPERPAPRMDPDARSRYMFGVTRRVLEARSRREPAAIVFEDLHWIDGASEAFVANLVDAIRETRTVLVVNFRPEFHAEWLDHLHCRLVPLSPLGPHATGELLADLLGPNPSLAPLADKIGSRAAGNPFFVEEVVRSLAETGVLEGRHGSYRMLREPKELAIPPTVHAVLAARIDRLAEREKAALQMAAVIGKELSLPVAARVSGMDEHDLEVLFHRLVAAEFLYEQAFFPETVYAFKHPLTQEVAYHSQLSERRASVHAKVAEAVADVPADKADAIAGLVAHHWERAGNDLEAVRWRRRAAEWAEMRNLGEALRHWQKVRELSDRLPESPETMMYGLLSRGGMIGLGIWQGDPENQTATLYAEGREIANRLGDDRALALLEAAYSAALSSAGDIEAAVEHSLEGMRLATKSGDEDAKLALRVPVVYSFEIAGRIEEALAITEEAIAHPPADLKQGISALGFSPYAFLVLFRGELLTHVGRLTEARAQLEEALALARRLDEPEITGLAHGFFCYFGRCSGEADVARRHAPDAIALAERIGSPLSRSFAYRGLALSHLMSGEWAAAAAALEKGLEIARRNRTVLWLQCYTLSDLAETYALLGRADDARATIELALAAARAMPSKNSLGHAKLSLARVRTHLDGIAAATEIEAALDDALANAHATYVPQVHVAYADLAALRGDGAARKRELERALALFTETGATGHARSVARDLATLESPADAEVSA